MHHSLQIMFILPLMTGHLFSKATILAGWETSARPLANASENLAGWVENRPGQAEFFIGYIRDCPVRAKVKKI